MLDLAILADDGTFAITVDARTPAHGGNQLVGQHQAKGLQILHRWLQIGVIATRKGVGADGNGSPAQTRGIQRSAAFVQDFLNLDGDLSHGKLRQGASPQGLGTRRSCDQGAGKGPPLQYDRHFCDGAPRPRPRSGQWQPQQRSRGRHQL